VAEVVLPEDDDAQVVAAAQAIGDIDAGGRRRDPRTRRRDSRAWRRDPRTRRSDARTWRCDALIWRRDAWRLRRAAAEEGARQHRRQKSETVHSRIRRPRIRGAKVVARIAFLSS